MKKQFLHFLTLLFSVTCYAQHDQHNSGGEAGMSYTFSKNLPMQRKGSGTSWHPDASPVYGYMLHSGNWMMMIHGNLFLRYNKQDVFEAGSRGASKFDSPNWFMFMGQRPVGIKSSFMFSTMLSLDPITIGGAGYPLLFQTGETWKGKPLIDRQHPHDFFSELAIGYSYSANEDVDLVLYGGYPAEPALGPPVFMHRPSALNNPDAPLGHHWQDATHIAFGVATAGFRYRSVKIEGSLFTGREPDEDRLAFDPPRFDSRSVRLSFNPGENYALQASHAFLKSPEAHDPAHDQTRTSASFLYSKELATNRIFSSALVWGMNTLENNDSRHSFLAEFVTQFIRIGFYGRYEYVQKDPEELPVSFILDDIFHVNALTLGLNYSFLQKWKTDFIAGAQSTLYRSPAQLNHNSLYGEFPVAFEVYLRVSPGLIKHKMTEPQKPGNQQHHDHKH